MEPKERLESALKLIERTACVYLGTLDQNGAPMIKVVTKNIHDGMKSFWFVTLTHRKRTEDICRDGRASLYFADNTAFETLMLQGRAEITRDPEILKAMWNDGMTGFFKQGVDDPEYSAIVFTAEGGNYYRWPYVGTFELKGGEQVWLSWSKHE